MNARCQNEYPPLKVNGVVSADGIRYFGIATHYEGNKYRCIAAVGSCMCSVEITVTFPGACS